MRERKVRVKEFTIDRSRWLCGELERSGVEAENMSTLLDSDGRMCCLGFYARACGVKRSDILDEPTYECLQLKAAKKLPEVFCKVDDAHPHLVDVSNTDLAHTFMKLNDSASRTARTREKMLTSKFKKIGIKVKFVGEYPTPKDADS